VLAIVDAGPLFAVLDADDRDYQRCRTLLERVDLQLVIPSLVVAEVIYLAGTRLGARVEASFIRGLLGFEVVPPEPEDWQTIASFVERYADFPLGGVDASVAVLAERLQTDLIITLDRRHFGALRTASGRSFTLLPD
jgi:predicted nucleic acid-binding protein